MKGFISASVLTLVLFSGLAVSQPVIMLSDLSGGGAKPVTLRDDVAAASELSNGFGAKSYSLEFMGDGSEVTAITLSMNVAGKAQVDLSSCLSGLPSSHIGVCELKGSQVKVAIFSMSNSPLPTGLIGNIQVSGGGVVIDSETVSFADAAAGAVGGEVIQ